MYPKKGHGHWWSAACLIYYSFLNPGETITSEKYGKQIDEMHPKPPCLNPALVNRQGPILLCNNAQPHVTQPTLQKLNKLGYNVLPHLPYSLTSHQPTTTSSSISTTFCGENAFTTSRMQKTLPKRSWNSKPWIFRLQE